MQPGKHVLFGGDVVDVSAGGVVSTAVATTVDSRTSIRLKPWPATPRWLPTPAIGSTR